MFFSVSLFSVLLSPNTNCEILPHQSYNALEWPVNLVEVGNLSPFLKIRIFNLITYACIIFSLNYQNLNFQLILNTINKLSISHLWVNRYWKLSADSESASNSEEKECRMYLKLIMKVFIILSRSIYWVYSRFTHVTKTQKRKL